MTEEEKPKKKKGPPKGRPLTTNRKTIREKTAAMIANPGGKPSMLEEAAPKIIASVRNGNTYECACGCARVSYSAFSLWMRRAREDLENNKLDSKYLKFLIDIQQAETECEQEIVASWKGFTCDNWQAAKEFLRHRNPDKWVIREKVDVVQNVELSQKSLLEIPDNGRRE